jgi:zinc protease
MKLVAIRYLTGAFVLAATVATAAGAQGGPRIEHETYTLPNGLRVILHQDNTVPVAAVNVWYHVGSGDERPGRTGFAHLFEHILFMGSENVPVGMFDVWLEEAGANNNGSTNFDRTNYFEWMPSNALPLALWLEADRMGWLLPTLDQSKLDVQRDVVKNERRQRVDNVPYGRAFEQLLVALYPDGHPYSWPVIGYMEDLSAATLDDVVHFFRTYYVPNNASLVVAGAFDRDSVRTWIERYFGEIPRGVIDQPRPTLPAERLARDTFLVMEDRVQLPRVYYAWQSVEAFHADDAALEVLSYVLAGDRNSRLYRRLVYDMQIAQDVNAFQSGNKLDGFFLVTTTARAGNEPARLAEVLDEELNRIARDGLQMRELQRAQNSIAANFIRRLEGVLGKAEQLNYYNYFAGSPDFVQRDAERYARVTAADVQRVARYLQGAKVVLTVVPEGQQEMMVRGGAR